MNWKPVTESDYDPNPKPNGIPFVLTPAEKSKAAVYSMALERNRRRQNELELQRALTHWRPDGDAA